MQNRMPKLYVAGPGGFNKSGEKYLYEVLIPEFTALGFDILNPWQLTPPAVIDAVLAIPYGEKRRSEWRRVNAIIGKNNDDAIRRSDIIFADLNGPVVDDGTSGEIGFGAALGKRVEGLRDDMRPIGDNEGSIVNLQIQYFIEMNGGKIHDNLNDLIASLLAFRERFGNS